ncbi:MAG: hypothetical protein JO144_09395, partial [Actinobacteria bacterium]|nr:hypothetical protein [Actinomycetota bacterium]
AGAVGGSDSGAGAGAGAATPSWLAVSSTGGAHAVGSGNGTGNGAGGAAAEAIPTDGWFDSNLPPAAEQPEAGNLRASDDDPDSRAAHEGIADMLVKRPDDPTA